MSCTGQGSGPSLHLFMKPDPPLQTCSLASRPASWVSSRVLPRGSGCLGQPGSSELRGHAPLAKGLRGFWAKGDSLCATPTSVQLHASPSHLQLMQPHYMCNLCNPIVCSTCTISPHTQLMQPHRICSYTIPSFVLFMQSHHMRSSCNPTVCAIYVIPLRV